MEELYWDPFDYDLQANPHPAWRRMREEAPLYYNERYDFWALTRFDDVLSALVDWKTFSSAKGDVIEVIRGGELNEYARSLIAEDPPPHTVHRQLLSRAFTPRAVKGVEDRVRAFAQRTLDAQIGSGGFDFVDDYGALVPGMVIAAMLGTPDSDLEEIRRLTDAKLHIQPDKPFDRSTFDELSKELGQYFMDLARARRKDPGDDIMSALMTMEFTDERGVTRPLHDLEAVSYITLLSAAGNETTARLTGWLAATLAQYPDQRAKLVEDPNLIPNGVEEVLRYEPPAMALARVVKRDVTIHDQVIPEGSVVMLVQAATGRDQRRFPNPDTLDVARPIDRILSFGFGPHVCLGASLARMEGRVVLEEMLGRFPEWDVEWDQTEMIHTGSQVRGYSKLPITL
jgi:cytochrome P450